MKIIIKATIFLLVLALVGYLGVRIYRLGVARSNREALPDFSFVTLNNKSYTKKDLPDSVHTLIINYFSPDCDYCRFMAGSFWTNRNRFNNTFVIMVTGADSAITARFSTDYKMNELPNLVIVRDPQTRFPGLFGSSAIPSFFIYSHQRLVKQFFGETKVDNLLSFK